MNTWYFTGSGYSDENTILDYINKRTNQNIVLKKNAFSSLIKMLILISALGSVLYIGIKLRWIISIPISWLVIASIVFLLCCGGTVHNILHKTPLMGLTKTKSGQTEYEYFSTGVLLLMITSQQREQYALEGYIASGLSNLFDHFIVLLIGGSFVLAFFIIGMNQ